MNVILYMRSLMNEVGLTQWTIEKSNEECPKDSLAQIHHTELQHAYLTLSLDFWKQDSVDQKMTLLHEMCHIPMWSLSFMVDGMRQGLKRNMRKSWKRPLEDGEECVVEFFARALARFLPLPGHLCEMDGCIDRDCSHSSPASP